MALYYLTLLNFMYGCKLRLKEEILSMACIGALGRRVGLSRRRCGQVVMNTLLPLSEEISHEHIDHLSNSALI